MPAKPVILKATDSIAMGVEKHLRSMQAGGYGELVAERSALGIMVGFGGVRVHGETYDIALVRLAGAVLNDTRIGDAFLQRLGGSIPLASH
ncbi:MAG: hypothetical protein ABJF10_16950 [Chthoniobacter sp.]|uniref:hypothetical protein n=1 Tax=Chthoniobacter sp. TaxID=2510640 RepID=UPI0032A8B07C